MPDYTHGDAQGRSPDAQGVSADYAAPLPPLEGNPLFAVVGGKSYALTPDGNYLMPSPEADAPVVTDPPGDES